MRLVLSFFLVFWLNSFLTQVESGVLDGVFVQEHVPTRGKLIKDIPIYIQEIEDSTDNANYVLLTSDSLFLSYTHSTHGVITKQLDTIIDTSDPLIKQLLNEGKFFCSYRFLYSAVLANFSDKIQIFHKDDLVFSVSYYNFINDAYFKGNILFDDLVMKMHEFRVVATELESPIYPGFNTD